MQEDYDNNLSIPPPSKLISQMEDLYDEYQNVNDANRKNEIKDEASEILKQVAKGIEKKEYGMRMGQMNDLLELHEKICILDS